MDNKIHQLMFRIERDHNNKKDIKYRFDTFKLLSKEFESYLAQSQDNELTTITTKIDMDNPITYKITIGVSSNHASDDQIDNKLKTIIKKVENINKNNKVKCYFEKIYSNKMEN